MPQRMFSTVLWLCLVGSTVACTDAPVAPGPSATARNSTTIIPVVPLADAPEPGQRPCTSGAFRQFDFWLGQWNVAALGTHAGTNRILSEVDGCLIAEYWVAAGGFPGWSLNAFDPETGRWYQHWVSAGGLNLFLDGGLQGQTMVISGPRTLANGTTVIDRIAYTPFPGGLRQLWDVSTDGGLTFPIIAFDGSYAAQPHIVPAPEVSVPCSAAAYRGADFLLGEWMIWTPDGNYVGQTQFSSELSDCLLHQTVTGRAGYEAKAFLAFGRLAGLWRLTHVGSDGERIFLEGTASVGSLVLQGNEVDGGVPSLVRLTYQQVHPDLVTQRWERSTDNGSTWQQRAVFELRRH